MPSKTKRINITPTPEFRAWLERYAQEHEMEIVEAMLSFSEEAVFQAGFDGEISKGRGKYVRKQSEQEVLWKKILEARPIASE